MFRTLHKSRILGRNIIFQGFTGLGYLVATHAPSLTGLNAFASCTGPIRPKRANEDSQQVFETQAVKAHATRGAYLLRRALVDRGDDDDNDRNRNNRHHEGAPLPTIQENINRRDDWFTREITRRLIDRYVHERVWFRLLTVSHIHPNHGMFM